MSQMSAHMLMPLYSALPEKEKRAFDQWLEKQRKPQPKPKKKKQSILHKVADQLGEEWRPGNEEQLLSMIMHGKN
ncbi:hypothetical protein E0K83_03775 [Gramella sp. BOM4]|nr:hypothetical protein [Christiangramia bathymodioli]